MTNAEREQFLLRNDRRILADVTGWLVDVPALADKTCMLGIWDRIFNCFVSGE